MKTSLSLVGCAVGLAALALTGASAEPAAFSIQLVSTFDFPGTGNQTRPQKINDKGDIVGVYLDNAGASRGFLRKNNGSFAQPIVDPNDTVNFTEGRGINNSRLICGDYTNSSGAFEGFFLQGHTYTDYDIEPTFTIVLGVNNAGDFCGSVIPSSGTQEAFVSIGGTVTEFAVTGATASLAYQINSTNTSCGYYIDADGVTTHGYFRTPNGTIHGGIDPAGSTGTIVFGNNDANWIVGRYADAGGLTHGFLFIPPNRFVLYDFPGSTFTSLNGINRDNTITGRYTDSAGFDHGIIAQVTRGAGSVELPLATGSAAAPALPLRAADANPAY
ncbi:MAG TPA: hypothetical protein VGI60_09785 [Chthoniobacterales bacterium]